MKKYNLADRNICKKYINFIFIIIKEYIFPFIYLLIETKVTENKLLIRDIETKNIMTKCTFAHKRIFC